ncbi:MAG: hypothetical protein OXR84_10990 [Magnetovibrio sp.]|nr:hypothetical protein [Magnetovibrio sp.]
MLDRIFAIGSLIGLVIFVGVVIKFVAEPDLWIVCIGVLLIAVYFVVRELLAGGSHLEDEHHDKAS